MPGGLIPVFLLAVAALLSTRARDDAHPRDLRDALLPACLVTGLWIFLGAELLSAAHALARPALLAWWGLPVAALLFLLWRCRRRLPPLPRLPADPCARALLLPTILILAITGLSAVLTPPNTWDSLGYHLPRQVFWLQQRGVQHFGAHDLRELELSPFAEFIGVHLMALSGGDSWANLIQWSALLITALAASTIARDLGGPPRAQALAALLIVTYPAAAAQAANAKNDLVAAMFVSVLAALGVQVWTRRRCTAADAALIALALGLAILTKGTAYPIVAPVCILAGIAILRARGGRGLPLGAAIGLIALAINLPHYARNHHAFGSPLGVPDARGGYGYGSTTFSPAAVTSTVLRNISLHTATPSPALNQRQADALAAIHRGLGIDPNDPRTTLNSARFEIKYDRIAEELVPGPAHLLAALLALGVIAAAPRRALAGPGAAFMAVPFAAFVLFCAMLKWQPWHPRLHIPIAALLAPAAGVVLLRPRIAPLGALTAAAAALLVLPTLLFGKPKGLFCDLTPLAADRPMQLFRGNPGLAAVTAAAARDTAAREPRTVALSMGDSLFEYPTLRTLLDALPPSTRLTNLNPNFGPRPPKDAPPPDAVLVWADNAPEPTAVVQRETGHCFIPVASLPPWTVCIPAAAVPADPSTPAFSGFESAEGLSPAEGPYRPQEPAPVRWARTPQTRLTFSSDGRPAVLVLECRRNGTTDQALTVRLNGQELRRVGFGYAPAYLPLRIPLQPRPGPNELTLEYRNIGAPGRPASVLYRRIQILPGQP